MEWLSERFAPGPLFGWLCVAFVLAMPTLWLAHRRRGAAATARFSSVALLEPVAPSLRQRLHFLPKLLRTAAAAAIVIALARPQSHGQVSDTREGIAIQMVLDVSGSMAEQDFVLDGAPVRRLDAVKKVLHDFVGGGERLKGRENDLVGMTTFAMYADTAVPLTLDHGSLLDLLLDTEIPGWVGGRKVRDDLEANFTSLGEAIILATDDLRRAGEQALAGVPGAEPAKSRVIILLTDGKDNPPRDPGADPPNPIAAARVAATLGIKIYTIGAVGSAAATRRDLSFFFQPRAEVDEPTLKAIAEATGGRYFRATDTESLVTIYDEIGRLETKRTGERSFQDNTHAAKLSMAAALGFLLLELLLAQTVLRRVP